MGNDEDKFGSVDINLLEIMLRGSEVWNLWRAENLTVKIDLSRADLSRANLNYANLSSANLSRADLDGAYLIGAIIPNETQFDIRIFDKDINSTVLESLKAAIEKYTIAAGYTEISILSEDYGSWFKRIRNKISGFISPELQEKAIQARVSARKLRL